MDDLNKCARTAFNDTTRTYGPCPNDKEEPHTCPFKLEIQDDRSTCNCCASCTRECAYDV